MLIFNSRIVKILKSCFFVHFIKLSKKSHKTVQHACSAFLTSPPPISCIRSPPGRGPAFCIPIIFSYYQAIFLQFCQPLSFPFPPIKMTDFCLSFSSLGRRRFWEALCRGPHISVVFCPLRPADLYISYKTLKLRVQIRKNFFRKNVKITSLFLKLSLLYKAAPSFFLQPAHPSSHLHLLLLSV